MKRVLSLIIVLAAYSCIGGFGFVLDKKIIDNYYLIAVDIDEQCALCHRDKGENGASIVIRPTVFAAGYNDQYIIAKQHPLIEARHDSIDKSITNYYIVPRKEEIKNWTEYYTLIIGPLTELEFTEKRKELSIPDEVTFSIVLKDLE